MRSRFLSRDSWRGRSPSQLSRIEIESEYSINLLVVQNETSKLSKFSSQTLQKREEEGAILLTAATHDLSQNR